jgi:hypothetical protein
MLILNFNTLYISEIFMQKYFAQTGNDYISLDVRKRNAWIFTSGLYEGKWVRVTKTQSLLKLNSNC